MKFQPNRVLLVTVLALLMAGPVLAAGFAVPQQGGKASGRGGAFVAQADDATAAYHNPAAALHLEGWNLSVGFGGSFYDTSFDPKMGSSADMNDESLYLGNLFFTGELTDHYAFSVGLYSPYAIRTSWPKEDPLEKSSLKTRWSTHELSLTMAARITSEWSLAAGLTYTKLDMDDFSRAFDFEGPDGEGLVSQLEPTMDPFRAEQNFNMDGEDTGALVAVHYRGEENGYRFGFVYRSKRTINVSGELNWTEVTDGMILDDGEKYLFRAPSPVSIELLEDVTGQPMKSVFNDVDSRADIVLPQSMQAGFGQEGLGKWDWEVDVLYTEWSSFKNVDIDVKDQGGLAQASIDFQTGELTATDLDFTNADHEQREDWGNSVTLSAGVDYHFNEHHTARAGIVFDDSPIAEDRVRPYYPDSDKIGITGGYGWQSASGMIKVDVYGQYWFVDDAEPGSSDFDYVIPGTYELDLFAAGASVQVHF